VGNLDGMLWLGQFKKLLITVYCFRPTFHEIFQHSLVKAS
jgi:hypothetical protein